jgi:hypothetical protein
MIESWINQTLLRPAAICRRLANDRSSKPAICMDRPATVGSLTDKPKMLPARLRPIARYNIFSAVGRYAIGRMAAEHSPRSVPLGAVSRIRMAAEHSPRSVPLGVVSRIRMAAEHSRHRASKSSPDMLSLKVVYKDAEARKDPSSDYSKTSNNYLDSLFGENIRYLLFYQQSICFPWRRDPYIGPTNGRCRLKPQHPLSNSSIQSKLTIQSRAACVT